MHRASTCLCHEYKLISNWTSIDVCRSCFKLSVTYFKRADTEIRPSRRMPVCTIKSRQFLPGYIIGVRLKAKLKNISSMASSDVTCRGWVSIGHLLLFKVDLSMFKVKSQVVSHRQPGFARFNWSQQQNRYGKDKANLHYIGLYTHSRYYCKEITTATKKRHFICPWGSLFEKWRRGADAYGRLIY